MAAAISQAAGLHVVIVGGGVVGSSIGECMSREAANAADPPPPLPPPPPPLLATPAYQLSKKSVSTVVIDEAGVAAAASGKAGGFLAKGWNAGGAVGALSDLSFDMHEILAQELAESVGADVDYRRLKCNAVAVREGGKPASRKLEGVEWADLGVQGSQMMGEEDTIAQVHPKKLTEAMMEAATKAGHAEFRRAKVAKVACSSEGGACVTLESGEEVAGDAVVIAAGPWSNLAALLGESSPSLKRQQRLTMLGQKYHSVVIRPKSGRVLNEAVFFQGLGDPEVYPRPDGEVYVCGYPDQPEVVAERPGQVVVRPEAIARLRFAAGAVSTELASAHAGPIEAASPAPHDPARWQLPASTRGRAEVVGEQSCHLPVTLDGTPIMGRVPGVDGPCFVCTGHSCWGILNAPASGLAMAELIADGEATCLDLAPFDPVRLCV